MPSTHTFPIEQLISAFQDQRLPAAQFTYEVFSESQIDKWPGSFSKTKRWLSPHISPKFQ